MRLDHPDGWVEVEELGGGAKKKLTVHPSNPSLFVPNTTCECSYPLEMIEHVWAVKGIDWLCYEIMRDEYPPCIEEPLRLSLLSYLDAEDFAGKTILDFGCGSGASSMVLCRLFPEANVIGVDMDEKLLGIARMRKRHWGFARADFLASPSPESLPKEIASVDFVVIHAVYEHLLPEERRQLLPMIWSIMKPRGVLFINGTPHRSSPTEGHCTGYPLINYLPDAMAFRIVKRYWKRTVPDETWQTLLRKGIRGGSANEILKILRRCGHPELLRPAKLGNRDCIDLWWSGTKCRSFANRAFRSVAKALQAVTGISFAPG